MVLGSSPLNFIQIPDKQEVDSMTPQPPPPPKKMLIQVDSCIFCYVSSVLVLKQRGSACIKLREHAFKNLYKFFSSLPGGPISQSACVSSKSFMFGYVSIGNHLHGESSRVVLGLVMLHKIGKCPPSSWD